MQNNRRHHKTRNKNRNHQTSYDSPEGEGEFLNESNDSMLTVSDSLGNMDPLDSSIMTEIDSTLLDEFAGDSDLSVDHSYPEGRESAPPRVGASAKRSSSRAATHKAKAHAPSPSKAPTKSKATVKASGSKLKDKVEPMLTRAQDFVQPYRDDLSLRFKDAYGVAKAKGRVIDKRLKTQPYIYALGAIVAGFALARIFTTNSLLKR